MHTNITQNGNHQGLGNELITPLPPTANDASPVMSRERLGGVFKYYYLAAWIVAK